MLSVLGGRAAVRWFSAKVGGRAAPLAAQGAGVANAAASAAGAAGAAGATAAGTPLPRLLEFAIEPSGAARENVPPLAAVDPPPADFTPDEAELREERTFVRWKSQKTCTVCGKRVHPDMVEPFEQTCATLWRHRVGLGKHRGACGLRAANTTPPSSFKRGSRGQPYFKSSFRSMPLLPIRWKTRIKITRVKFARVMTRRQLRDELQVEASRAAAAAGAAAP